MSSKGMKNNLVKMGKIVLGIVLLWFSIRNVSWTDLSVELISINKLWLMIALFSVFFGLWLKLVRWHLLLEYYGVKVSLLNLGSAYFLGQAMNILLPFRTGEVIRIGWLSVIKKEKIFQATLSVVIEKLLDIIPFTFLALFVINELPDELKEDILSKYLPIVILLFAFFVIIVFFLPAIIDKWKGQEAYTEKIVSKRNKIMTMAKLIVSETSWGKDPRKVIIISSITVLIWGVMLSTNLFLFRAMNMDHTVVVGILVLVLVYFGQLPNIMPGNIGPFYYFASLALTVSNTSRSLRLAYVILLHALVITPSLLLAGVALLMNGLRRHKKGI